MFLSKEQKQELKRKGIFFYSPITYLFTKALLIFVLFYFLASSLKSISEKLLNFSLQSNLFINEITSYFLFTSFVFLLVAIFFALLSSKFYLVSLKFKPRFKFPFSLSKGAIGLVLNFVNIFILILNLGVVSFLVVTSCWHIRFTDFSKSFFYNILIWYNTSYWQLILICCILLFVSLIVSYMFFNFKHYLKLRDK